MGVQRARERFWNGAGVLEARDLAPGVDAGVGAARDRERSALAEDALEGCLDLALDGALARLDRPAAKRRAVVGDREPGYRQGLTLSG
jgi:hypothetical protein